MVRLFLGAAVVAVSATVAAEAGEVVVGDLRIQALSSTLLRVEPRGPAGFENRTSFMVVKEPSSFPGIPISIASQSADTTILKTSDYNVVVPAQQAPPEPVKPTCSKPVAGFDVNDPITARAIKFPQGAKVTDQDGCCTACSSDASCNLWVFAPPSSSAASSESEGVTGSNDHDVPGANCWPLQSSQGYREASDRVVGCGPNSDCLAPTTPVALPTFLVTTTDGNTILYNSTADAAASGASCSGTDPTKCDAPCFWDKDAKQCTKLGAVPNLLHWPSPLQTTAYAIVDYPRFFTPAWGTAPIPANAKVDPALVPTNGYDFRNNVNGDTYVFLLGDSLDTYHNARREFVELAGPTPVLPDYAFGTWFTWWHPYTEVEAKSEVERWEADKLPIDIWALDMNWRNTSSNQDRYYDHPAIPNLFSNFSLWFEYLEQKGLRTYFNDHPFPVASRGAGGLQTSKSEVDFRWQGLSEWMDRGLTFWWFDHNWGFSIPPPFVNTSVTSGNWEGLDNAAWGSHVYFNAVSYFDETVRQPAGNTFYQRPMTLTKFGLPDWRHGMPATGHAESPAQHRFPVWWTGDGVGLQGSVESMVDSGIHDFKPYVHSDCGGDYRPKEGGDLLRWTGHCAFGSIHRFHGSDHRPWSYDNHTEDVIRSYLNTRYKLAPSLIAAGHQAAESGFPLVGRGDLFWPEHSTDGAYDNTQYLFINDTLVAPIFDSSHNITSRSVWVPPGDWEDAWTGEVVTGPLNISTSQPYEQIPMWHSKNGGLVILTDEPSLRIDNADWSTLTMEAFPARAGVATTTLRHVVPRNGTWADRIEVEMVVDSSGAMTVTVVPPASFNEHAATSPLQAWVLRVHLWPQQRVSAVTIDGEDALNSWLHIEPVAVGADYFPFGGIGASPAAAAGYVAEIHVPVAPSNHTRVITTHMDKSS